MDFNLFRGLTIALSLCRKHLRMCGVGVVVDERGEFVHLQHRIVAALDSAFSLDQQIDAFKYGSGRDLTGI